MSAYSEAIRAACPFAPERSITRPNESVMSAVLDALPQHLRGLARDPAYGTSTLAIMLEQRPEGKEWKTSDAMAAYFEHLATSPTRAEVYRFAAAWLQLEVLLETYTARIQRQEQEQQEAFFRENFPDPEALDELLTMCCAPRSSTSNPRLLPQVGSIALVALEQGRVTQADVLARFEEVHGNPGRHLHLLRRPRCSR